MLPSAPNGDGPATAPSEESFGNEVLELLDSLTPDVATALGKKGLAERMARLAAETNLAKDMAVAREVQNRLFPQRMPPLETLDYAGNCQEAQAIGGDYYDFLDMGRGRVGFLLADVSGKGISAALLMASLQGSLRSQRRLALDDLAGLFRAVNRQFCESVTLGFFATLFFAEYSDATRTLRYVNCGHHPPFLLRASGTIEKLHSTATVLGVFEKWDCSIGDTQMSPGDILVLYSDGVTEARSKAGDLFGEGGLLRAVRANASRGAADILRAIAASAHQFGGEVQEDDLTLLVARAR